MLADLNTFHLWIQQAIFNKIVVIVFVTPYLCSHTTLWNLQNQKRWNSDIFNTITSMYFMCHPFRLLDYYTDLHKKSFIVRSLYEYIEENSRLLVLVVLLSCVFIAFMFLYFHCYCIICLWCAFCRILIKITYLLTYL